MGQVGSLGVSTCSPQPLPTPLALADLDQDSAQEVLAGLSSITWPASARSYVSGRALCVGGIAASIGGLSVWSGDAELRFVITKVNAVLRRLVEQTGWQVCWSSLQVNHNTVAQWHKDVKNVGLSIIISVGTFSGGQFELRGLPPFDLRDKAMLFDGSVSHRSAQFDGERWSVVAFLSGAVKWATDAQRQLLLDLGFSLPPASPPPCRGSPLCSSKRRPGAEEVYVGRNANLGSGYWGNPFKTVRGSDGSEAVASYEASLRSDKEKLWKLADLGGRTLVCHCPEGRPCHIDAIIRVYKEHYAFEEPAVSLSRAYEDKRKFYAAHDTSDEEEDGVPRPLLGSGRRGTGRPLLTYVNGKRRWFEDGAGLCSPGRWRPECRCGGEDVVRPALFAELIRTMRKVLDPKELACRLACNRVEECPFPGSLVDAINGVLQDFVASRGLARPTADLPIGQKIRLPLLAAVAEAFGDPDWRILTASKDSYLTGVPLGVDRPLPRTPAVFGRKVSWRKYEDQGQLPSSKHNYSSCVDNVRAVEAQFEQERDLGFMREVSEEELRREYGEEVCVAAIGAIEKSDASFRIIHDGTHGVQVNPRIVQRDQVRNPGVNEFKLIARYASERGKSVFFRPDGRHIKGSSSTSCASARSWATSLPVTGRPLLGQSSGHLRHWIGGVLVGEACSDWRPDGFVHSGSLLALAAPLCGRLPVVRVGRSPFRLVGPQHSAPTLSRLPLCLEEV